MATVPELCKLLNNPLRLKMLTRVYASRDGVNVGILVDEMLNEGLNQSGVSQYLKQLEHLGVIRRERAGRYVNYYADCTNCDSRVAEAVRLIIGRVRSNGEMSFTRFFGVLMNPFRAAVITYLAAGNAGDPVSICTAFGHQRKYLRRDLQMALDEGLLAVDDSSEILGVYSYVKPADALVATLVRLCERPTYYNKWAVGGRANDPWWRSEIMLGKLTNGRLSALRGGLV